MTDTIKLVFTYGIAAAVIVGGGIMLYLTRLDGVSDFQLVLAGFIGSAITFVFSQESAKSATRAAQSSADQASIATAANMTR
jgi:hypothetical protein